MIRRKLEEFELHETIGVGTVGTIYRATDLSHEQHVALKILLPEVSGDPLIHARFEREMVILERLSHRNIVRYFGGGSSDSQLFYAMELVTGGSLKEMLQQSGRLPWREATTIGVQICSALQHAHNHGIIHRDLKPSNLLFTDEGQVKLSDFGIALDANATTITADGITVGSYAYMPPEQIQGEKAITGKADLYAFGCLMFEMLSGRPPYPGDNFAQIFEQHLHSPPPSVATIESSCPAGLDVIVKNLLQKSPEERPFNARAVQGAMMEVLDPDPNRETRQQSESDDVPASEAVNLGQQAVSERIAHMHQRSDVSWWSLAGLLLVVVAIVAAACLFGT